MANRRSVNGAQPRSGAVNDRLVNGGSGRGAFPLVDNTVSASLTAVWSFLAGSTRTAVWGSSNIRQIRLPWNDAVRTSAARTALWSGTIRVAATVTAPFAITTANPVAKTIKITWSLMPDR